MRGRSIIAFVLSTIVPAGSVKASCPPASGMALQHPSTRTLETGFGMRRHPLLGDMRMHTGIDYVGPLGDPVHAAEAGEVTRAVFEAMSGNRVEVDHGNGLVTTYAHLQAIEVAVGTCVASGQRIGRMGSTGLSAGPHLHFEVIGAGRPVNPEPFLPLR